MTGYLAALIAHGGGTTIFQEFIRALNHTLQHLHALRGTGFRLAHCHYKPLAHITGTGTWRTIGTHACVLQQNVHIVQPAGK